MVFHAKRSEESPQLAPELNESHDGMNSSAAFKAAALQQLVENDNEASVCASTRPEKWMEELTKADFVAPQGELAGKNSLFYIYGPPIQAQDANGQVGLITFDGQKTLDFYWAKPSCQGKTANACSGGTGNLPSGIIKNSLAGAYNEVDNTISNKYPPPDKFELIQDDKQKWYAKGPMDGQDCFVDRVYVCTTNWMKLPTEWITMGYTQPGKQGVECVAKGPVASSSSW